MAPVWDFSPPLQLDIFIFLFSKGGMLGSGCHMYGLADKLAGVYIAVILRLNNSSSLSPQLNTSQGPPTSADRLTRRKYDELTKTT
jgi:hypothetical protein